MRLNSPLPQWLLFSGWLLILILLPLDIQAGDTICKLCSTPVDDYGRCTNPHCPPNSDSDSDSGSDSDSDDTPGTEILGASFSCHIKTQDSSASFFSTLNILLPQTGSPAFPSARVFPAFIASTLQNQQQKTKARAQCMNAPYPWLSEINRWKEAQGNGFLDGVENSLSLNYSRTSVNLSHKKELVPQLLQLFTGAPMLLLLEMTVWEKNQTNIFEQYTYYYAFEVINLRRIAVLTDDKSAFRNQFLVPGETNDVEYLIEQIRKRMTSHDQISAFVYKHKRRLQ